MKNQIYKEKEQELVILLTKYELNSDEIDKLKSIVCNYLDWSKVFGYLTMHKLLGIAWKNIKTYCLNEKYIFSLKKFPHWIEERYRYLKIKHNYQLKETSSVCVQMEKLNIDYVLLKGLPLSLLSYSEDSIRDFQDNDILVHRKDLRRTQDLFLSLNYLQGRANVITDEIITATRKEVITQPLVSHEVFPYIKRTNNELLRYHIMDLHFSVDLLSNNKTDDMVKHMLMSSMKINSNQSSLSTLNYEFSLIFLCIHFYKEAIHEFEIKNYKDLALYKLCDIQNFIQKNRCTINWQSFISLIKDYGFEKAAYFSLYYTNSIYDLGIEAIINQIPIKNNYFLNLFYINDNQHEWVDNLSDRIFDFERAKKIEHLI